MCLWVCTKRHCSNFRKTVNFSVLQRFYYAASLFNELLHIVFQTSSMLWLTLLLLATCPHSLRRQLAPPSPLSVDLRLQLCRREDRLLSSLAQPREETTVGLSEEQEDREPVQ